MECTPPGSSCRSAPRECARGVALAAGAWAIAALLTAGTAPAQATAAAEIRFAQRDYLTARLARSPGSGLESRRGYFDVLVHSLAVVNKGSAPVDLVEVFVELLEGGELMQRTRVGSTDLAGGLRRVRMSVSLGAPIFLDVPFGHRSLFRDGESVATSMNLATDSGFIVNDLYLAVRGLPDQLRATAVLNGPEGRFEVSNSIQVRRPKPANDYSFPLEPGPWFVFADGLLSSHHRFTQGTEFAIDITLIDEHGRAFRDTGRQWTDWYAYGKKVLAAAPGEVVKVVADSTLDPDKFGKRDNESTSQYFGRIGARQQKRFLAAGGDPLEVAGGNYVVIAHEHGEFSQYLHLAHGSVLVEEGDLVERGQPIAAVGGTGELPWAHLHFQVTDAFDPDDVLAITVAHCLPVTFTNGAGPNRLTQPPEPGLFVEVR